MLPSFLQNLALEEAFEPVVQQNEKIKKRNSNVRGTKKNQTFNRYIFSFSHKTWIIVNKSDATERILALYVVGKFSQRARSMHDVA